MKRIWKQIPGYEGLYEASNEGVIRNVKNKRIISAFNNRQTGIYMVNLFDKDRNLKQPRLINIIASLFVDNPNNFTIVRNLDGNISNCKWWNLRWVMNNEIPVVKIVNDKIEETYDSSKHAAYENDMTNRKILELCRVPKLFGDDVIFSTEYKFKPEVIWLNVPSNPIYKVSSELEVINDIDGEKVQLSYDERQAMYKESFEFED